MAGGALRIKYTGAEASCLLLADGTGQTLTSKIGDAGSESEDPNFGAAGVLDLTAAANDTLLELKDVIDGYADYSAEIFYGDDDIDTGGILDAEAQAKDLWGYILFAIASYLDTENSLVTWEKTQQLLDLDDDQQTKIELLINSASAAANAYTKRLLKTRSYTELMNGTGKTTLLLPQYPVTELTSLYIDRNRVFGADTEITDYYLDEKTGELYYKNTFPKIWKCVKGIFVAGFGVALYEIPEDIQIAVVETVQWYRARLSGEGIGVTAIQNPNGITTRFEADLPVSARRRLDPYVRAE